MPLILKVFCSGAEQERVAALGRVVARYDAFVVLEMNEDDARRLAASHPVEDITGQYAIGSEGGSIDTTPAVPATAGARAPRAAKRAAPLTPGPHHYLVQFVGPIKAEWLAAVKKAGGQAREPYSDFTYVVRADEKALARIRALPVVRWVGHLPYANRIAPSLAGARPVAADPAGPDSGQGPIRCPGGERWRAS
jgi:serine protease AprX